MHTRWTHTSFAQVGHHWVVDVMVQTPSGNKIAIEVDGPQHFAVTRLRNGTIAANIHPLGKTKIRDMCLQRIGLSVVSFSTKDLDFHSPQSKKASIKLLQDRIKAADT